MNNEQNFILEGLEKIKNENFKSGKATLFKNVSNNKILKVIVHLVYNVISYINARI